jgi:hypothetical protein
MSVIDVVRVPDPWEFLDDPAADPLALLVPSVPQPDAVDWLTERMRFHAEHPTR